ncbi:peptidoglycan-binding domain-containing protein [Nonomuraea sp. MCN248]|uniref:Peptidoglycan-binding domain-containing protein n=1 Tax=Nonomuraea corallina TaxID=2989783 RepID=A0ABT4S559_9ACTN|nr:peptidoglycan-binding domain-containing protein [Nonomuraea corallina]MDA0632327.1 peptidoglycan-binding domain-containing protein [Nonomuraea corallina]
MRRGTLIAAVMAVTLAGGAAAAVALTGRQETPVTTAAPAATAEVVRGDLVDSVALKGTVRFAGDRRILVGRAGTITWVPGPGTVIKPGGVLFRVDRRPAVLMRGGLPMYRTLRQGVSDGPDVTQLERGLRSLGYGDGVTVDRHYSWETARAVRDWQRAYGLERTGTVDAAQVVFLPGTVRVGEARVAVGDPVAPGRQVLAVSGVRQVVHLDLDAGRQDLAREGTGVSVELPDGKTVKGEVVSVGPVVRAEGSGGTERSTVDVRIRLKGRKKAIGQDRTPVTVTLRDRRREDVLSVPVEALLALPDGGFGVEVAEPGETARTLSVRTGAYGDGRVEVSAPGLRAGVKVTVPAP